MREILGSSLVEWYIIVIMYIINLRLGSIIKKTHFHTIIGCT
jgi:predicted membrane-bound spermidine synthase